MFIDQLVKEDVLVKIVDPSNREIIGTFNSYAEAGKKLHMSPRVIKSAACSKTRRFCNLLNKEIAVRIISKDRAGAL